MRYMAVLWGEKRNDVTAFRFPKKIRVGKEKRRRSHMEACWVTVKRRRKGEEKRRKEKDWRLGCKGRRENEMKRKRRRKMKK